MRIRRLRFNSKLGKGRPGLYLSRPTTGPLKGSKLGEQVHGESNLIARLPRAITVSSGERQGLSVCGKRIGKELPFRGTGPRNRSIGREHATLDGPRLT